MLWSVQSSARAVPRHCPTYRSRQVSGQGRGASKKHMTTQERGHEEGDVVWRRSSEPPVPELDRSERTRSHEHKM